MGAAEVGERKAAEDALVHVVVERVGQGRAERLDRPEEVLLLQIEVDVFNDDGGPVKADEGGISTAWSRVDSKL